MQLDQLEEELERIEAAGELGKVKLIYAVSYYENPSGISLSVERRRDLVSLAERWSRDQQDLHARRCRLSRAALRRARSAERLELRPVARDGDPGPNVLQELFARAPLSVMACCPSRSCGRSADRKGNEDFGSSNFVQHLLATVLESGLYELARRAGAGVLPGEAGPHAGRGGEVFLRSARRLWVRPEGGLYVWMTLPEQIQTGLRQPVLRPGRQSRRRDVRPRRAELRRHARPTPHATRCDSASASNRPTRSKKACGGCPTPCEPCSNGRTRLLPTVRGFRCAMHPGHRASDELSRAIYRSRGSMPMLQWGQRT